MKHLLGCFLYRSELASNANRSCVADIARVSRLLNEGNDITGILIFDGLRFVQYMEGPEHQVDALIQTLMATQFHPPVQGYRYH